MVLGTASREARANESQKLLNWGFQAFDAVRLFDAGKPIVTPGSGRARSARPTLGAAGALSCRGAARRGRQAARPQIERTDPLVAPLAKGQRVGTLKVTTAGGAAVAEVPLVVLEAVRAGRHRSGAPGMRCGCGSSELPWHFAATGAACRHEAP